MASNIRQGAAANDSKDVLINQYLSSSQADSAENNVDNDDAGASLKPVDILAEGLFSFLRPIVIDLDDSVMSVRESQVELRQRIESLASDLKTISENCQQPLELEPYTKKLNNIRRRVMLVNNILQNAQERLGKLHHAVVLETSRREASIAETSGNATKLVDEKTELSEKNLDPAQAADSDSNVTSHSAVASKLDEGPNQATALEQ